MAAITAVETFDVRFPTSRGIERGRESCRWSIALTIAALALRAVVEIARAASGARG